MECDLEFSISSSADTGSFKLVELPQDLYELICNSPDSSNPIKYLRFSLFTRIRRVFAGSLSKV